MAKKRDLLSDLSIFPELITNCPDKCAKVVVIPTNNRTTYHGTVTARAKDIHGTIRYVRVRADEFRWTAERWESVYDVFEVQE